MGKAVAAEVLHFQHRLQVTIVDRCAVLFFGAGLLCAAGQQTLNQHFLGEVLYGTFQGNHAVSHNGNFGGNFKDFRQSVSNVDDGDAFLLQVFHCFEQCLYLVEGQGTGRLVQDQDPGVPHHAPEQLHHLLFRNGKGVGLPLQVQGEVQLSHAVNQPLLQVGFPLVKAHEDVFQHRHVGEEHGLLGHQINAVRQGGGSLAKLHALTVQQNFPFITGVNTHDDLHQGGLACPVAADESHNLSCVYAKVNPFQHHVLPESLSNALDLKSRGCRRFHGHNIQLLYLLLQMFCYYTFH